MEGATFRPELIASAPGEEDYHPSVRDRGGIKTEDFLIFYGKVAKERRLKLQQDLLDTEDQKLTFQPQINTKSRYIAEQLAAAVDEENIKDSQNKLMNGPNKKPERYQQLYFEGLLRK